MNTLTTNQDLIDITSQAQEQASLRKCKAPILVSRKVYETCIESVGEDKAALTIAMYMFLALRNHDNFSKPDIAVFSHYYKPYGQTKETKIMLKSVITDSKEPAIIVSMLTE